MVNEKPLHEMFEWLMQYHYSVNLQRCIRHIKEGVINDTNGSPLKEGTSENPYYEGMLIISDGETLLDRLVKDEFIPEKKGCNFVPMETEIDFLNYMHSRTKADGAYICNMKDKTIARVRRFDSDPHPENSPSIESMVSCELPKDFVFSEGGNIEYVADNIGSKTDLAMRAVLAYDDVDAFQIKRTAHGKLGMGMVTHFGDLENYDGTSKKRGLVESFEFEYDNSASEHAIDDQLPIVGIYTKYKYENGKVVPEYSVKVKTVNDQVIIPSEVKAEKSYSGKLDCAFCGGY